MSQSNNPVLHSELSKVYIHSTLFTTLKKFYLSKSEIPAFKKLIEYYDCVEPNQDLFKELQNLLDILDTYRKNETLKNEHKLQMVHDRMDQQHGSLFFKQKIVDHIKEWLGSSDERTCSQILHSEELGQLLERIRNVRWKNIVRDICASMYDDSCIVPVVQRLETPRSVDSRVSSSTSSSGSMDLSPIASNFYQSHRRIYMTHSGDEIDLDAEKARLSMTFLLSGTEQSEVFIRKLKDAFLLERNMLESDVDYIRQVLDNESDFNYKASNFILPTSKELSEIEHYISEMMEQHKLQAKMDRHATRKSKVLTPRKPKLPTPKTEKHNDKLVSHTQNSRFKLPDKENMLTRTKRKPARKAPSGVKRSHHAHSTSHRAHANITGKTTQSMHNTRSRPSSANRLRQAVLSNRRS